MRCEDAQSQGRPYEEVSNANAMTTWRCACGAVNDVAQRVCDQCGADRVRRPASLPAYREAEGRVLVREALSEETRAGLDALYASWGIGRRFGERQPMTPPDPTETERAAHERRKREILASLRESSA